MSSAVTPLDYNNYVKNKDMYQQIKLYIYDNKKGGENNFLDDSDDNLDNNSDEEKEGKFDIVTYLNTAPNDDIQKNLLDKMSNNQYCDTILGEGMMGKVYSPKTCNRMKISVNGKKISMPIAIKVAKEKGEFGFNVIDNRLYFHAYKNITPEALILEYTNALWYSGYGLHLPLMIGYSMCKDDDKSEKYVTNIITERHGLPDNKKVMLDDPNKLDLSGLFHKAKYSDSSSHLATLDDLLRYININCKNNILVLPNGIECDVITLIDSLTVSYLHTFHLLVQNKIIVGDSHSKNMFIHWLNKNSHSGEKNIKNLKQIIYKTNNKYIQIDTFGLILKFGDVGMSYVVQRDDFWICGQLVDIDKTYTKLKTYIKCHNENIITFLSLFSRMLPFNMIKDTIIYKIFDTYPYDQFTNVHKKISIVNDLKSGEELLNTFFDKYVIDKPNKKKLDSDDVILCKIKTI